jgi:hypothetical protein
MPVNKFGRSQRITASATTPEAHTTIRIVESLNKGEDFLLNVGSDNNRTLGCADLIQDKTFTLSLGDEQNKIVHTKGGNVQIMTSGGLEISSASNIALFKTGELDGFTVKNLPEPIFDGDAATMGYVKQMCSTTSTAAPQHRTVEGVIPNAPYTNIILMRYDQPPKLLNVYAECVNGQWVDVTCGNFNEYFKNYKLFVEDNILYCHFTSTAMTSSKKYKIIYN